MSSQQTRRQHFSPRFVLRGFTSSEGRKDSFTWVYSRAAIAERIVLNVGVETDYYGSPDDDSLERRLAGEEGPLAAFTSSIRSCQPGAVADAASCAKLVVHLSLRGLTIRSGCTAIAEATLPTMSAQLERFGSDPRGRDQLVRHFTNKMLEEAVKTYKVPVDHVEQFRALFERTVRQQLSAGEFGRLLSALGEMMDLGKIVKDAHLKALRGDDAVAGHAKHWSHAAWHVYDVTGSRLVLGDVGAMGLAQESGVFRNLVIKDDPPSTAALLPISERRLLVGVVKNAPQFDLNIDVVNMASAELSTRFFVASERNPGFEQLRSRIGRRSEIIPIDQLNELARSAIEEQYGSDG